MQLSTKFQQFTKNYGSSDYQEKMIMIYQPDADKISVIIPVYNGSNYLREAIESVLSQSYTNLEIIVVDDGSTDDTWQIIASYEPKVKGISKKNGGVASAFNGGIQQSTGKYIAFLSHDDIFYPSKLEKQILYLQQHPEFSGCYTNYAEINAEGKVIRHVNVPWYPREKALLTTFKSSYINGSTLIAERRVFDKVGLFSEDLKFTQDTEMWFRILLHFDLGHVPDILGGYRLHGAQDSKKYHIHHKETAQMLYRIFKMVDKSQLFPQFSRRSAGPELIAMTDTWLANTLILYRGYFHMASKLFEESITTFPSWKNPAQYFLFMSNLASPLEPLYHDIIHILSRLRQWAEK